MTVEVFDPEMCCTNGVCGPAPDPALVALSRLLDELRAHGAQVARYQLSRQPQAFVRNQDVYRLVLERGVASLPVVAVDGRIVSIGHYPGPDALGAPLPPPHPRRRRPRAVAAAPPEPRAAEAENHATRE